MAAEPAAEKTPLEERLISLIKANGPISVADFMADALGHPHDGYYMSQSAIGADGDFTTAPEISQIFGELIGLWLVHAWLEMGEPTTFNLVELGPGRGVLMADILRAAELRPGFLKSATLWLVETSGRLRHEQQKRLRSTSLKPLWADDFSEIAPAPCLIVANEFFDCLPIRQFEYTEAGWRERMIGIAGDGVSLEFTLAKTPPPAGLIVAPTENVEPGAVYELCEGGLELTAEIARTIGEHSGKALIVDYGHVGGLGDTLQAVRHHQYWPVLAAPGRADVTAHVDFSALARAAIDAGAAAWGPVPQGVFLGRLGLAARLARLTAGKSEAEIEKLKSGAARISAPEQMGEVFKVLCVSSPNLSPPAGFEAA